MKTLFSCFIILGSLVDDCETELAKELDHDGKGLAATVADVKDAKKRGSLFFAAGEGKFDLCKYLVEDLKIDVNERDKERILYRVINLSFIHH